MLDYNSILSTRCLDIQPSGIRKYFDIASKMENVVSLGVGEPDFKTPWAVRAAAIRTLEKGKTSYTGNAGLVQLKTEIAKYYHSRYNVQYNDENEVLVTVGGSEAIDICIRAIINPEDEVLVVEPCFVAYAPIITLTGGVCVPIHTRVEDKFRLTKQQLLDAITPKTKMLILPFPSNPTGAIMPRESLEEIAEVLRERNIIVLSDEIYSELTYNGNHVSIAELDGMRERTVVINGFSKSYSMTGWRLGYALAPAPIIQQMTKIHQFAIMCAPTTSQHAAIEALTNCDESIRTMRNDYNLRRRFIVDSFNKLGLECFEPDGAFYIFPSIKSTGLTSDEFCEKLLLSKQVALVPGGAFGKCGEGHIRVSYSYSINHIKIAVQRIAEFLEELKDEQ